MNLCRLSLRGPCSSRAAAVASRANNRIICTRIYNQAGKTGGKTTIASSSKRKPSSAGGVDVPPPPPPPPSAAAAPTAVAIAGDATLVRSSRGGRRSGTASARRGESARGVVDPLAGVRGRFVVADPATGALALDFGCMGRGKLQWWAVDAVEGREVRFVELLLRQAAANGVTRSVASDIEALTGSAASGRGRGDGDDDDNNLPSELPAAAGVLAPPDADGPGALIGSLDGPLQGWVPRKQVQAYSPSSDKLSPKTVPLREGVVYLRCVMDADVHGTIVQTPFFQGWRRPHVATYDGVLLARAGLLPAGEDAGAVFEVPHPLPAAEVAALLKWQATPEAEDADARRREVYGAAGGPTFGVTGRRDLDKASLDRDERGRTIYKRGTGPGTHANPSAWYDGSGRSSRGVDGNEEADTRGAAPSRARRTRGGSFGGARSSGDGGGGDGTRHGRQRTSYERFDNGGSSHEDDYEGGFDFAPGQQQRQQQHRQQRRRQQFDARGSRQHDAYGGGGRGGGGFGDAWEQGPQAQLDNGDAWLPIEPWQERQQQQQHNGDEGAWGDDGPWGWEEGRGDGFDDGGFDSSRAAATNEGAPLDGSSRPRRRTTRRAA